MNPDARHHLSCDSVLAPWLDRLDSITLIRDQDIYTRLMRALVGQQLSVKAASTIWERFLALYPGVYPKPEAVLNTSVEDLRKCGLSNQKAAYIRNIAAFSIENPMDITYLETLENEEIITYLTQIKGVGRWTVEMILIFALGREDVFPVDDMGIRNAIAGLYNIRSEGAKLKADLYRISAKWAPYRSYACIALWRWKDNATLKS